MSKRTATKDRVEVRKWMLDHGIRACDIREAIQYKHHSPISETLSGKQNNRKVLFYLKGRGCPAKYLKIPNKMEQK